MNTALKSRFRVQAIAASLLLAAVLIGPSLVYAQVTSLQQEVESLLTQIAAVTASATPSTTASASMQSTRSSMSTSNNSTQGGIICPTFIHALLLGSSGTDVANLQGFLAQNPLIYPERRVTAYFGMLTQDAVKRWQSAYHVVSSGSPTTTGYGVVGTRTAAAMSASCTSHTSSSANQTGNMVTNSTQQALCPIASQPATPCAGTWSPLTNATGCTIAWQCAAPLPGAVTAVQTSSSVSAVPSTCPIYTLPLCTGGVDQWLGMGSNGCNLGYQCIHPGQ
jgi:peptidoglycan hydrolase-like protein with peptidoglycan-binding domain